MAEQIGTTPWEVVGPGAVACHHCGAPSEVVRRRKSIPVGEEVAAGILVLCLRCTAPTCAVIWYGPGQFEGVLRRLAQRLERSSTGRAMPLDLERP